MRSILALGVLVVASLASAACGIGGDGGADAGPPPFLRGTATVSSDDLEIVYAFWPSRTPGSGKLPILLLGGLPTDVKEDWRAVALALSEDRDVVTVDPRGVGETGLGPTPGDHTLNQMNSDIQGLMEHLWGDSPPSPPVIVGCSVRGRIALAIGLSAHQRISGIVVGSTSGGGALEHPGPDRDAFVDLFADASWGPRPTLADAQAIADIAVDDGFARLRLVGALLQHERSSEGANRAAPLATATVGPVQFISDPTLVLHATADGVYAPATGTDLATEIGPNAEHEAVPGAHAFWIEQPAAFAARIRAFVDAIPPP